jgi:two-component system NarL family response regulator
MQQSVRVVIREGNAVIRESLATVVNLQPDMEVVAKAANTSEALAQCQLTKPDVVLMDLEMSKMDGIKAVATIQETLPETSVIVLTTSDGDELAAKGIKAGARRSLLKDSAPQEVIDAIRLVHQWIIPNIVPGLIPE